MLGNFHGIAITKKPDGGMTQHGKGKAERPKKERGRKTRKHTKIQTLAIKKGRPIKPKKRNGRLRGEGKRRSGGNQNDH